MRKKIPKLVVFVSTAVVTALLVCSYYRARMPQNSVSYRKAKYRALSGVKGQVKGHVRLDSWNENQHGDITGSIQKRINRIYVTSAANKRIQSDLSENGGFISKVHVPARTSGIVDLVSVLQQNEWREAGRNVPDMNSYVHGSDDLQPNDRNNDGSRSHTIAPASAKSNLARSNMTMHKNLEWIPQKKVPPNSNCSDPLCSEYLMPQDLSNFKTCASRARARYRRLLNSSDTDVTLPLGKCHFMDGRNRSAIALVSFPGSGNTWVRGLLEQATGVCTGAIYCDRAFRMNGFNGEGVQSGVVLVVKAHSVTPHWTTTKNIDFDEKGRPLYSSAILLVRNPLDALVSEWNRKKVLEMKAGQNGSSHTTSAGPEFFGNNREWNRFVMQRVIRWKILFSWAINSTDNHPTLVVRYEDLKQNIVRETKRMVDFLGFPLKEEVIKERLAKDFSLFQRRHRKHFEHFTAKQRKHVINCVQLAKMDLKQHIDTSFGIEEYLT